MQEEENRLKQQLTSAEPGEKRSSSPEAEEAQEEAEERAGRTHHGCLVCKSVVFTELLEDEAADEEEDACFRPDQQGRTERLWVIGVFDS
ncbi:hypothetical protein PAMP_015335 [Pampus punctatissimus]